MSLDQGGSSPGLPPNRPRIRDEAAKAATGVPAGEAAAASLRLAVSVAETGLKGASRVTAELIRRLPRR